jgi:hypothetical protein
VPIEEEEGVGIYRRVWQEEASDLLVVLIKHNLVLCSSVSQPLSKSLTKTCF